MLYFFQAFLRLFIAIFYVPFYDEKSSARKRAKHRTLFLFDAIFYDYRVACRYGVLWKIFHCFFSTEISIEQRPSFLFQAETFSFKSAEKEVFSRVLIGFI